MENKYKTLIDTMMSWNTSSSSWKEDLEYKYNEVSEILRAIECYIRELRSSREKLPRPMDDGFDANGYDYEELKALDEPLDKLSVQAYCTYREIEYFSRRVHRYIEAKDK